MTWIWLFLAGGLGSLLRYGMAGWVQERAGSGFPWGTLGVNALGCLAIGLLATLAEERSAMSPELRMALLVGFLGGFTTFSTFGLETWRLLAGAEVAAAAANVALSVSLGLAAVVAGVQLARWLP